MATERAGKGDVSDKARNRGIAAVIAELTAETGRHVALRLADGTTLVGVWKRDIDSIDWLHNEHRTMWVRLSHVVGFYPDIPQPPQ